MKDLTALYASVAHRVQPPVCIALGPPWPVANLVKSISGVSTTCVQFDLHQSARVRECLEEVGATAEVATLADLWDLPPRFNTVIFPASAQADRELKLDIVRAGLSHPRAGRPVPDAFRVREGQPVREVAEEDLWEVRRDAVERTRHGILQPQDR